MDESTLPADESDEEFRKMEKDIDKFLSNIRKNVSNNNDPQSEATCSGVHNNYDSVSSDDFENERAYHSLQSRGGKPGFFNRGKKPSCKNRQRWRQWKGKGQGIRKQRRASSREEQHSDGRRGWRQRELSTSEDEYDHYRRDSSSRIDNYQPHASFPSREKDEFHWSLSPRERKVFHHERSLSPRGSAYHYRRSLSPRERDEYREGISLSPEGLDNHEEERLFSRHRYKRRQFSHERTEEHYQDDYSFSENFSYDRPLGSRSSENESIYHRIYAEESDSPSDWTENQDNDYEYGDQNSNPYWIHEDDPFMEEDGDGQSFSTGIMNTSSIITSCLEKVVAVNPALGHKLSEACMSLLNKSVDRTCDSDYEYEESSRTSFVDESGRISPRSWRDSRSPSFSKSLNSFSGPSGPRHYKNRHEGHSRRIVVEGSCSPSPQPGHSSDDRLNEVRYSSGRDKKRSAVTSQTLSTKKRSSIFRHRNDHEEDPKASVARSIRKIRKQCEAESNSTVRRALLALLEVHQRECNIYLRKPEAHPDYNKEYRVFLDKKSKSIIDLGGDPNDYDFQEEWKKYWPTQIMKLFRESWNTKMHKCTSMLKRKGHLAQSLHASFRKDMISPPQVKKQKISEHESERENTEKIQNQSKNVKSPEEQQGSQVASATQGKVKKEEMHAEILSILKLLNHIKHKFKDCETSFNSFYQEILSLEQSNVDLCDVLQDNLSLLKKIDVNLSETLLDENLTLIQKAIIQETHERYKCFLKKSKAFNSHSMKNIDNTEDKARGMTEAHEEVKITNSSDMTGKILETSSVTISDEKNSIPVKEMHQIPCHVTDLHPSVVTSLRTEQVTTSYKCCHTDMRRTLTQVSIQGSSCTADGAPNKPKDGSTSISTSLLNKTQDEKLFTCKSETIGIEKDNDMMQPPPPGVTPPPPGVTPPPPGVTPPPPGVITPPGVTLPPLRVKPLPPTTSVASSSHLSITSSSLAVTAPPAVAPPFCSITSPSSITPSGHSVKLPLHSAASPSDTSTLLNITAPVSSVTPPPSSVVLPSPGITPPPPGVTPPPASLTTPVSTLSQASFSGSESSHVTNVQLSIDTASAAVQHPSTISTSVVHSSKSLNNKHIVTVSQTQKVHQPSKELLRSTIKDCFVSATSPSKENIGTSSIQEPITLYNEAEESAVSSVPSLPEDILRMFVVKPEDKSEFNANNILSVKMNSRKKNEKDIKPADKKPIKITIPQFSKRKSMPTFNPIVDDQELL